MRTHNFKWLYIWKQNMNLILSSLHLEFLLFTNLLFKEFQRKLWMKVGETDPQLGALVLADNWVQYSETTRLHLSIYLSVISFLRNLFHFHSSGLGGYWALMLFMSTYTYSHYPWEGIEKQNDAILLKTIGTQKYAAYAKKPRGNLEKIDTNTWQRKQKEWESLRKDKSSGKINKSQRPEMHSNK